MEEDKVQKRVAWILIILFIIIFIILPIYVYNNSSIRENKNYQDITEEKQILLDEPINIIIETTPTPIIQEQEIIETPVTEVTPQPQLPMTSPAAAHIGEFIGYFTLIAYCPCTQCCGIYASGYTASGTKATSNHTIAASSSFAFGTKLSINGIEYVVEDRGGAINGNKLDIYFDTHAEALAFGRKVNIPVYYAE